MMKKWLFFILTLTLVLPVASCSDDVNEEADTDFTPIQFYFNITDADGNFLLQSEEMRKMLSEKITMEYNGVVYNVVDGRSQSLYYMPDFYGIALQKSSASDGYVLTVGEFDGSKNVNNASFTINWSDGTTDVVSYSNNVKKKGAETVIDRKFYWNGELLNEYTDECNCYINKKLN